MECPLCHEAWSYELHIPRILSCGHTLCESCSKKYFILNTIRCKECHSTHVFEIDRTFNETDTEFMQKCINSLSKNFSLFSIINNHSAVVKLEELDLQICGDHNLPIHSYTEKPQSELCDECIQEVKGLGLDIKPIPYIVKYFNELIEKLKKKLAVNHEKVENLLNQFESSENFETRRGEKIVSGFFEKLFACLNEAEAEIQIKVKKLANEEKVVNEKAVEALKKREKLLESLLEQQNYLKNMTELDIVRNTEILEMLIEKSKPQNPLSLKNLAFSCNKAKLLKIKTLVESSLSMEIIKKSALWKCKCGELNTEGVIICNNCEKFRPINTYSSISNQFSVVSENELKEINMRRAQELQKVKVLNEENREGVFYLIHAEWVNCWKSFIFFGTKNFEFGPLPPGPISNFLLFENEECTILRQGLLPNLDYYPINSGLWDYFFHNYGGGPIIKRKQTGIYQVKAR